MAQKKNTTGKKTTSTAKKTNTSGARKTSTSSASRSNSNTRPATRSTSSSKGKSQAGSKRRRNKQVKRALLIVEALIVVALLAFIISFFRKDKGDTLVDLLQKDVFVDGYNTAEMSQVEMKQALMAKYPWSMQVTFEGNSHDVPNYMEEVIDAVLNEAYSNPTKDTYTLEIVDVDAKASGVAAEIATLYSSPAQDATIESYDSENAKFIISEASIGYEIDVEGLQQAVSTALTGKNYTTSIEADKIVEYPTVSANDIQVIATYTTYTTANEDRNTNVRLACEQVCGTILQPGEQFSYNGVVGRRTPERGFKEAGAYANGEHVVEYGGGVCQVSSTLYNASVAAGLQIDDRRGHTFEPTYVTPGQDATVSYDTPDYKFSNNTETALGIKATYYNRTVVVEIYGKRILEEGVKQYMRSEKIESTDPGYTYTEDPTVPPGQVIIDSGSKPATKWKTYIVTERNGVNEGEEYLHTTSYKGTPGTCRGNSGGTIANGTIMPAPGAPAADPAAPQ